MVSSCMAPTVVGAGSPSPACAVRQVAGAERPGVGRPRYSVAVPGARYSPLVPTSQGVCTVSATWKLFERWRTAKSIKTAAEGAAVLGLRKSTVQFWKDGRNGGVDVIERMAGDLGEDPIPHIIEAMREAAATAEQKRTWARLAKRIGSAAAVALALFANAPGAGATPKPVNNTGYTLCEISPRRPDAASLSRLIGRHGASQRPCREIAPLLRVGAARHRAPGAKFLRPAVAFSMRDAAGDAGATDRLRSRGHRTRKAWGRCWLLRCAWAVFRGGRVAWRVAKPKPGFERQSAYPDRDDDEPDEIGKEHAASDGHDSGQHVGPRRGLSSGVVVAHVPSPCRREGTTTVEPLGRARSVPATPPCGMLDRSCLGLCEYKIFYISYT